MNLNVWEVNLSSLRKGTVQADVCKTSNLFVYIDIHILVITRIDSYLWACVCIGVHAYHKHLSTRLRTHTHAQAHYSVHTHRLTSVRQIIHPLSVICTGIVQSQIVPYPFICLYTIFRERVYLCSLGMDYKCTERWARTYVIPDCYAVLHYQTFSAADAYAHKHVQNAIR